MMNHKIHIVLVDDHELVREGLVSRINAEPDLFVVDSCGNADAAIELVQRHRPDEVLMDVDMPGTSCFAAARAMAEAEQTRVIFFSAHHHDHYIDQALGARAWGYVTKGDRFSTLCEAMRMVARGRVYYSQDVQTRLVAYEHGRPVGDAAKSRAATLTAREIEVLRHLALGLGVKGIARVMGLRPRTVDNHKTNIMRKLDIHDRVELARFALREGITTL